MPEALVIVRPIKQASHLQSSRPDECRWERKLIVPINKKIVRHNRKNFIGVKIDILHRCCTTIDNTYKKVKDTVVDKMSAHITILFVIITLFIVQCTDDENPITAPGSDNEYGKLSINTDKDVYSWQQDESIDIISIQGQLENKSDSIFYSRLGDWYNSSSEQEELLIADNSAGYIEKYNESDNSWHEIEILAELEEGSKFVPIKPLLIYSIYGHLIKDNDTEEKGKYRLRVDYYEHEHPNSTVSPFQDYSNTFRIQ